LGECLNRWNELQYLENSMDPSKKVSVHVCPENRLSFLAGGSKNYGFNVESWAEFLNNCIRTGGGEYRYLRTIGENPRKEPADFVKSFPELAKDFSLPEELLNCIHRFSRGEVFSSVLRVSSPELHLWTHYDIMDNFLVQITGEKFVTLFPPDSLDSLYVPPGMNQSSSPITDLFAPHSRPFLDNGVQIYLDGIYNHADYPKFKEALDSAWTELLRPGDVLFIPALWFHNTYAMESSVPVISINMFWKSMQGDLYDRKDLYGNKDLIPAVEAANYFAKAIESLAQIPGSIHQPTSFKGFYWKKLQQIVTEQ
jgi:hypothetical protein